MKTKYNWKKWPSVMTGGKKYFYYLNHANTNRVESYWIVWDRWDLEYKFKSDRVKYANHPDLKEIFKLAENWLDKQYVGG